MDGVLPTHNAANDPYHRYRPRKSLLLYLNPRQISLLPMPLQVSVAVVQFSPVQGEISPNPELDFGSGSQLSPNLNRTSREPVLRSSSGSLGVRTQTGPEGGKGLGHCAREFCRETARRSSSGSACWKGEAPGAHSCSCAERIAGISAQPLMTTILRYSGAPCQGSRKVAG